MSNSSPLTIVPATMPHVHELLKAPLYAPSVAAWKSATGEGPTATQLSVLLDGSPGGGRAALNSQSRCVCLFGAALFLGMEATGYLWVVAADGFFEQSKCPHLRLDFHAALHDFHKEFGSLFALVERNCTPLMEWLADIGFEEGGDVASTVNENVFRLYVRKLPACAHHAQEQLDGLRACLP